MQKKPTILLLYLYQVFMFLQGYPCIFLYFVFTLVGQFFSGQTLQTLKIAIGLSLTICPEVLLPCSKEFPHLLPLTFAVELDRI